MSADPGRKSTVNSSGYRLYTGSQAVSIVGTMMTYTALYWLILHIARGNGFVLSGLVAAQFLPMLVFSRRAGSIVSRHRAVRMVLVTQSAQAVGSLALGLPLLGGWAPVWYLWVLSFAVGCAQAVDVPARQVLMRDLVGDSGLRRGSSLYAAVTGLSKIAGPAIAGAVIAASGEAAVFLIDAASFALVVAVLARLARSPLHPGALAEPEAPGARRFRWVLDLPRDVQVAAAMALLIGGFGIQFAVTNPLMATRVFHLSALGFGLLGTLTAVGGIAGNFWSSRRDDPSYREFLTWALLFGLAETLAGVMPAAWAYGLLMIATGAAIQLFAVSATVYVQKNSAARQRGHALTAYNAAFMGFVPAGSFLVAGLASTAGTRWALVTPGTVILITAALTLTTSFQRPVQASSASSSATGPSSSSITRSSGTP